MQVLSYSPSVEAYVKVGSGEVVDLSPDITSFNVSRVTDGSSTFSATLQNKKGKYNGLFGCFDPVVVYATKSERTKLFTGYLTGFDAFRLYEADFKISGMCTLYRLQKLYWDPYLMSSQQLMFNDYTSFDDFDDGCVEIARRLLKGVAKWPDDSILIQDRIPDEVVRWAEELYAMKSDDVKQSSAMLDEFYSILQRRGPSISSSSSGNVFSVASGIGRSIVFTGSDSTATDRQKHLVEVAHNYADYGIVPIAGWCGQWVTDVYAAAGEQPPYGNAIDYWTQWSSSGGTDVSKAPLGSVIVGSGSGLDGAKYGHVGIRVEGGDVISNVGSIKVESMQSFNDWQTAVCQGHQGIIGWVWPNGIRLDG